MVLESVTVQVPARQARDADLAEFGDLSSVLRRRFGRAAIRAGGGAVDDLEGAAETIANILHALPRGIDQEAVLERALELYRRWPPT